MDSMLDIFRLKVHNSQHGTDNTESRDPHIKDKDISMATDADKDDHSPNVPIGTKTAHFNKDNTADMNVINMIDPTLINSLRTKSTISKTRSTISGPESSSTQ